MLKLIKLWVKFGVFPQPPSGGCVLKLYYRGLGKLMFYPAAFRRLCVETSSRA
ncbi:hypothetical protein [Neisseria flavescens]|uniref:hypothetical protein n=1 Tax=Neisseria flavescens TaxID=484 RepID=UPI003D80717F